MLRGLGVGSGERVFALPGRVPELYVAALGTLKNGSVFCPLFSAFGPEPIRAADAIGERHGAGHHADACTGARWPRCAPSCPSLEHVLLVDAGGVAGGRARIDLRRADGGRSRDAFEIAPTDPEDMALLHFTSGTTGTPKGAVHVHEAVRRPPRHRPARARPAPGRRLLVHGRSRLGDRHLLRHHRAARPTA